MDWTDLSGWIAGREVLFSGMPVAFTAGALLARLALGLRDRLVARRENRRRRDQEKEQRRRQVADFYLRAYTALVLRRGLAGTAEPPCGIDRLTVAQTCAWLGEPIPAWAEGSASFTEMGDLRF